MTFERLLRLRHRLVSALIAVVAVSACAAPPPAGGPSPEGGDRVETGSLEIPAAETAGSEETIPREPRFESNPRFSDEIRVFEGSGEVVWAEGFEGELIAGLDGSEYLPYTVLAIERMQGLLRDRGLYLGPTNGVLDLPTMQAIAMFQEATQTLQVCGIPTPRTRLMLQQGSHTI